MPSWQGKNWKRFILTTHRLPDHPHPWRQEMVRWALEDEEKPDLSQQYLNIIMQALVRHGYLERSTTKFSTQRGEHSAVRSKWYRFTRPDRESTRPRYRPGEVYHKHLWEGKRTPHSEKVEPTDRQLDAMKPVMRAKNPETLAGTPRGVPEPKDIEWEGWEEVTKDLVSRTTIWLPRDVRLKAEQLSEATGQTMSGMFREAFMRYLTQKPWNRR